MTDSPIALTRDDISQLRRADSVVFRFDARDYGFSRIEGTIQGKGDQRYSAAREFTIPVNPTSVEAYGGVAIQGGCWILNPAKFIPSWATVVDLLRTDDRLYPHYVANDSPSRLMEAGFVHDTFDLRVHRPYGSAGRVKILTFGLDSQVIEHDSLARNLTTAARMARS